MGEPESRAEVTGAFRSACGRCDLCRRGYPAKCPYGEMLGLQTPGAQHGRTCGVDRNFIRSFTEGFDSMAAGIGATSWQAIQEGSGLTYEQIKAAGAMCAQAKRMICGWATGLTQQPNGVSNVASVVNLLLAGGHIGRPGASTCCIRGHSNVQGDRTMGVWERPPQPFLDALGQAFNFTPPAKRRQRVREE